MKQKDIAKQLNTTSVNVNRWLRGTREIPNKMLIPMAQVMGISVEDLLIRVTKQ